MVLYRCERADRKRWLCKVYSQNTFSKVCLSLASLTMTNEMLYCATMFDGSIGLVKLVQVLTDCDMVIGPV